MSRVGVMLVSGRGLCSVTPEKKCIISSPLETGGSYLLQLTPEVYKYFKSPGVKLFPRILSFNDRNWGNHQNPKPPIQRNHLISCLQLEFPYNLTTWFVFYVAMATTIGEENKTSPYFLLNPKSGHL